MTRAEALPIERMAQAYLLERRRAVGRGTAVDAQRQCVRNPGQPRPVPRQAKTKHRCGAVHRLLVKINTVKLERIARQRYYVTHRMTEVVTLDALCSGRSSLTRIVAEDLVRLRDRGHGELSRGPTNAAGRTGRAVLPAVTVGALVVLSTFTSGHLTSISIGPEMLFADGRIHISFTFAVLLTWRGRAS